MSFNTDTTIRNLISRPYDPPREPLADLLALRRELAEQIAHATNDGGDVPINWLADAAEMLQIELPCEECCG